MLKNDGLKQSRRIFDLPDHRGISSVIWLRQILDHLQTVTCNTDLLDIKVLRSCQSITTCHCLKSSGRIASIQREGRRSQELACLAATYNSKGSTISCLRYRRISIQLYHTYRRRYPLRLIERADLSPLYHLRPRILAKIL
jgi:hypothetical protein